MSRAASLQIAPGVALPLDAVTRTFGVLGQRGTGKTSAGVVMGEEMAKAGAHVCFLDPVGVHWGITRPGSGKGLPGVVIGGEHADVPLEETAGKLVAELVVGRHWPIVVVDMKLLRKGAQRRFMADFLETLYFTNRLPLHLFFEEADQALPQNPRGADPVMMRVLGAGEDIVKLGRSRGLGATLISQRPATVNKNVLEQVESLCLFRLMGPRDRKAAREWIEANADPAKEREVMDSLAGLGLGECWLWSPAWLKVLEQIRVRPRRTFDSSATPEVGAVLEEPSSRAAIDLDELRGRMAATIERAKENDPAELRRQIKALKAQLSSESPEHTTHTVRWVDVPVMTPDDWAKLRAIGVAWQDAAERMLRSFDEQMKQPLIALGDWEARTRETLAKMAAGVGESSKLQRPVSGPRTGGSDSPSAPPPSRQVQRTPSAPAAASNGDGLKLGKAHRAVLSVLAQFDPEPRSKRQLAMQTGYSGRGGGFNNALSALRSAGLITQGDPMRLTTEGFRAIDGHYEPLPQGPDLLEHWIGQLGKAEGLVLRHLANFRAGSKEDVAVHTGYTASGGGFNNALSRLRTLGLIEGRGELVLSSELEEALR